MSTLQRLEIVTEAQMQLLWDGGVVNGNPYSEDVMYLVASSNGPITTTELSVNYRATLEHPFGLTTKLTGNVVEIIPTGQKSAVEYGAQLCVYTQQYSYLRFLWWSGLGTAATQHSTEYGVKGITIDGNLLEYPQKAGTIALLDDAPYDLVIKTQEEFDAFTDSIKKETCTAHSVLLIGMFDDDGNSLPFTLTSKLILPDTLYSIEGRNNATIEYSGTGNVGIIQYSELHSNGQYYIKNLTVKVIKISAGAYYRIFLNCSNLINCIAHGDNSIVSIIPMTQVCAAYYNCSHLINCTGSIYESVPGKQYSFYDCSYLSMCGQDDGTSRTSLWGGTTLYRDDNTCELDEE